MKTDILTLTALAFIAGLLLSGISYYGGVSDEDEVNIQQAGVVQMRK